MRPPQPNLLDKFQEYLANNPDLTENAAKTYWSDLAVVVRAVFEACDNATLQALVEKSGYSGDYRSAMNHIRRVAQETQNPPGERIDRLKSVPSPESYAEALKSIEISDKQRQVLLANYHALYHIATATQLAEMAQIEGGYSVVNSLYGKLGHKLCDYLGFKIEPDSDQTQWWPILAIGYNGDQGFHWQLRDEVAKALETLNWTN